VLDDGTRTYAWDAENRLTGITDKASGTTSQLSYDGLSRRVAVIDRSGPGGAPRETCRELATSSITQ
jgi:YD repeat-containing protein